MSPAGEDPKQSDIILYVTEDGRSRILVKMDGGTVWLTQAQIAELFQTTPQNVTQHIAAIYEEKELEEGSTCKQYLQVRSEGGRDIARNLKHYDLRMILSVGYRVRSSRGVQFRQWATERLDEFLVKGFTIDGERLKQNTSPDDYFDDLLEQIREIRASERRFYQKITDIYSTACDYKNNEEAQLFFKTVQNKLHWAITGHTAAELIAKRANAEKANMGLASWRGKSIRKSDVAVAKNYLSKDELEELNRIVTMYLDYAEDQAKKRRAMTMREWAEKLDAFLQFNEREVLDSAGRVSQQVAEALAVEQYEKWHRRKVQVEAQEPTSDFDHFVERWGRKPKQNDPDEIL